MSTELADMLDSLGESTDTDNKPSAKPSADKPAAGPTMVQRPEMESFLDDIAGEAGEQEDERQEQASTPAATAGDAWTIEKFLAGKVADPENFLKGDEQIANWKAQKSLLQKALTENKALSMELHEARSVKPAPVQATEGAAMPETEAVTALQAELEQLRPLAEKARSVQAREDLRNNLAFQKQFDKPRADILASLEQTAKKIGLDKDLVEQFLRSDSEYDQARWIEDNLGDDRAASKIFEAKGGTFLSLTTDRTQVEATADPIKTLREFQDMEQAFGAHLAGKFSEGVANQFRAALPQARAELLSDDEGDSFFFSSAQGQEVLTEVWQHFDDGRGIVPADVIRSMALAQTAPVYKALLLRTKDQLRAAQEELRSIKRLDPAESFSGSLTPSGGNGSDDPFGFTTARKPMITADQLKR